MLMRVYQLVTRDKYRLPVAQADSIAELAEMTGKPYATVRKAFTRLFTGGRANQYQYVDIDTEEETTHDIHLR